MSWLANKIESLDDPGPPVDNSRSLNSTFTPSATKHVLVMYTIEIVNTSGQTATVDLCSDANATPTTVRCSAKLASGQTDGETVRQQLVFVVTPTHKVKLVSSGTGTPTIACQCEMVIS